MEGCRSGQTERPGEPWPLVGFVGSNPTPSALTNIKQIKIGIWPREGPIKYTINLRKLDFSKVCKEPNQ